MENLCPSPLNLPTPLTKVTWKGHMEEKISGTVAFYYHPKLPPGSARAFLSHELLNPVSSFVV